MLGIIDNYTENKGFNVGIYTRLSREDEATPESESIKNQKDFLASYVIDHGWNLVEIYCDDGYTGTNFDRPDFQQMLRDIINKKINMVVTKDLSRLGRDYIETGYYLERYFPEKNVRYVAVNDGIDTFKDTSNNDMSPFRSVINDMYAKDISKKVRAVMDNKRRNGKFIGAFAPYGYLKDPDNNNKLIIDNETVFTVKRIFEMYLNGHGYSYIANTLNEEGVLSPSAYKKLKTKYKSPRSRLNLWTHETVKRILTNPTYAGNLTQNRSVKINYKVKKLKTVPKKKWITVENTHDAIIDNQKFELVQQMIDKKISNEYTSNRLHHLLSGLLFCGDCGERMTFTKTQNKNSYCICSKYKRFKLCTRHSILEDKLEKYVLRELRKISKYAADKEKLLKIAKNKSNNSRVKEIDDESITINNRLNEIKRIIKSLYEDKLKGVLTDDYFIELTEEFNTEREQLNRRHANLERTKQEIVEINNETRGLIKLIKDVTGFQNINKTILSKLIDKIEIFEEQKVTVYYKFKKPF